MFHCYSRVSNGSQKYGNIPRIYRVNKIDPMVLSLVQVRKFISVLHE